MEFSELKETLSNAAKSAVNKSNEIVEATKLKFAISDAEGEISKLMRDIGKSIYDSYKNDTPPEESITENCAALDVKYAELGEMRAKLRVIRNVKACSECGEEVRSDSAFCHKCGAKV